jgi:Helix-turn-helix
MSHKSVPAVRIHLAPPASLQFSGFSSLAKSSGIPSSTLQAYEAGSLPGMHALLALAQVGNVDLNWLMTGNGEMRPVGLLPGAFLKDIVTVDQYELGTGLSMQSIVGHIPFSRDLLERKLRLQEPANATLLAVEAGSGLLGIGRGDLVLVDRKQASLGQDGVYLLDFPGLELRGVFRRAGDKVDVVGPERDKMRSRQEHRGGRKRIPASREISLNELLGVGRHSVSRVVGRAVWLGRTI